MQPADLPVNAVIADVVAALKQRVCVLQAPPGAGKSTQLPLALLTPAAFNISPANITTKLIILVQPRRVAALSIAHYLAAQLGEPVGERVGYWVRGQRKKSAKTRVLIVTDGMLTRIIQSDPELTAIGLIIFDEFHERNLHCDMGLALALEARELNPDVQLLIMSATLPAEALHQWLANVGIAAAVFVSEGRQFPISLHYRPPPQRSVGLPSGLSEWQAHLPAVVQEALSLATYGVLVFLPGQREIRWLREQLSLSPQVHYQELYGGLPLAAQQQVLQPLPSGSGIKLVLATNVAETSVTIPDIDVVVDSGRERQARFLPKYQFTQLQTRLIAHASAVQRAGRAGRTGPGHCFRLWPESMQQSLASFSKPAIELADLRPLVLEAAAWGSEVEQLPWFSPPPPTALQAARTGLHASQLLAQKEGPSRGYQLTALGHAVQQVGSDIDVAVMLTLVQENSAFAGVEYKQAAVLLASHLEAHELREGGEVQHILTQVLASPKRYPQTWQRLRYWCQQLSLELPKALPESNVLAELLLAVMPMRLCEQQQRAVNSGKANGHQQRYQMATGVALQPLESCRDLTRAPWLLALQVSWQEQQDSARLWQGLALTDEQVERWAVSLPEHTEWRWANGQRQLQLVARRSLGPLVFSERVLPQQPTREQREAALLSVLVERKEALFDSAEQWLRRVQLAAAGLGVNASDWQPARLLATIAQWATPYLHDLTTAQQAQAWQPLPALQAYLDQQTEFQGGRALALLAPCQWQAPSGRNHTIHYAADGAAVCALKLQEVFGTPVSPTLCQGAVTLTFELLSPAGRPLQKTSDLASFWRNGYVHVRKEMRGRYPKHPWPEHPETATPTHLTKRALQQ